MSAMSEQSDMSETCTESSADVSDDSANHGLKQKTLEQRRLGLFQSRMYRWRNTPKMSHL